MIFAFRFTFNVYHLGVVANRVSSWGSSSLSPSVLEFKVNDYAPGAIQKSTYFTNQRCQMLWFGALEILPLVGSL